MDDYLTKPIRKEPLAEALQKWMAPAAVATPDRAAAPLVATPVAFALDEALERASGDTELLRELVGLVLEDAPSQLAALAGARERDDREEIKRVAHSLTGVVSNMGARAMVAALRELEAVARGGTAQECGAPLARAQAEWQGLKHELVAWKGGP